MAMVSWLSWLLVIFATCGKVIGVEGDDFLDPFGEFDEFNPESFDDFDTFEGCGNRPMDIVLLVDTSEAYELNNETYRTIRDFLVKFVKFTNVSSEGTRISLVTYSTSPMVHFRLGEINTPQGVQDAIRSARFMPGERNLADALDTLRRRVFFEYYGDRPQVPDMVVLVTTGRSSRRVTQSFQYAQALKDIGVNVIGITWSEGGKQELSSVVSEPSYANLFSLDSISELHIMTELVVAQVCESSDAAYLTPVEGSDDMDLVFLVHFSNDLTSTNFAKITSFMADTVEGADIDLDSVRVGVAVYQAEGTVLFKLDAFRGDKSGLIDAIRNISPRYRSADTNLAAGLNLVRTQMFDVNKGDREDVPNGLVIITDANSEAQYYPELEYAAALVKDAGVTVFGVGIDLRNTDEMNLVSTNPQMSYVLGNVDQLPSMVQELRQKMPSLTFVLPEDIEPLPTTAAPTTVPTTEATTPAPTSALESSREADIAVLFHVGHKTKLRDLNKKLKIYLSNLFAKSKVGPDTLRVALVNYGTKTNVLFDFNAHTRKPQVRSAIKTTIKGNMRTSRANLGEALSMIRTDLLVSAAGSRIDQGVPTGLILVTDMVASNDGFDFEQEMTSLKQMGVTVFGVGIGSSDVHDELRQLTSDPKSDYFQGVQTFSDLLETADPVKNIINRVRAMGGKVKRRPTTIAPALSTTVAPVALSVSEDADIIIAVHSSITATPSHFTMLLEFLAELYEQADIDGGRVKAGVMFYGSAATPIFYLDQFNSWDEVFMTISRTSNRLRSNVVDASRAMRRASDMFGAARGGRIPKALIMVTDAASNENLDLIPERKEALANQGVSIYSVGVGLPGKEELELLATASENVFSVIGYEQLPRAAQDIKRRIRSLNTLPERVTDPPEINTSTGSPPAPVRTEAPTSDPGPIRVTFPSPDSELFGDEGLPSPLLPSVPQPQPGTAVIKECSEGRGDILFILDSSTSVGDENFRKMLNFMKDIVRAAPIDSGHYRVAVLVFNSNVKVTLLLDAIDNQEDLLTYIDNIPYSYGNTNTASALQAMRDTIFIPANGDRPDAKNLAIVLTDGESNINSGRTIPEADAAKREGVEIYGIGIGLMETSEIDGISSKPLDTHSFNVDNFDNLNDMKADIFSKICIGKYMHDLLIIAVFVPRSNLSQYR